MVIPTYNEAENIEWIVGRLRQSQPGVDVLIMDDNSPDGTGDIADAMSAADPQIHVIHRTEKAGLGAAYLHGFKWALEQGYDVIGEMDADGSHQPEELYRLLNGMHAADLVIGSRYIPGGSVLNWPIKRLIMSRGGNAYVRLLLGTPVHDITAGYRLFKASTLHTIDLDKIESAGYIFQTDMAARAVWAGLEVKEVPIQFVERVRGNSKLDGTVAKESIKMVTRWGIEKRKERWAEKKAARQA
jgi:dolichol-phosphate mannosyltransferase